MLPTWKIGRCAGITLLAASALAGCGDDQASDTGGTGAGGNATGSGGGNGEGGDGSGGRGSGPPLRLGYVSVYSGSYDAGGSPFSTFSANARFTNGSSPAGSACEQEPVGPCWVTTCPADGPPPAGPNPDAGVITVSVGTKTVTLTPDENGAYAEASGDEALWADGQTLSATGVGEEAPAFDLSVAVPGLVDVTAPVFPPSPEQLIVSKSADLVVGWSGGGPGSVAVYLSRTDETKNVVIGCVSEADAGQMTVPAAALASVPSGPSGYMQVISSNRSSISKPGWDITLNAGSLGSTANGSASVAATFE